MVGADGLHSNVRRLVFGEDAGHTQFLGGYLAVVSVPKMLARDGESLTDETNLADREKVLHILRRTWRKMSPNGQAEVLRLQLPDGVHRLVLKAMDGTSSP